MSETNGTMYPVGGRMSAMNELFIQNALMSRIDWMKKSGMDPRRDLYGECGYPTSEITVEDYWTMWERESVANRVVSILPRECWALPPKVYETEDETETAWEKAWNKLLDEFEIWNDLERLDTLSGIGPFGGLLIGLPGDLATPVKGIEPDGTWSPRVKDTELLYLRPFSARDLLITKVEDRVSNRRYGKPVMYSLKLPSVTEAGNIVPSGSSKAVEVHWTRILHLAEDGDTFGMPRMQPVFNRLMDLQKIYGGSAEMFYRGGFPGLVFEMDPELAYEGLDIVQLIDKKALKEEFKEYSEGLSRFLALTGFKAKSLAPMISDPKSHVDIQLDAICVTINTPKRILMGSEEGALASSQDQRTWNKRLFRRQHSFINPRIIRAFIWRLMGVGVLPRIEKIIINWPDLNTPTQDDQATVAQKRTQALSWYADKGVERYIPLKEYLTKFHGFSLEDAEAIVTAQEANNSKLKVKMGDFLKPKNDNPGGRDGLSGGNRPRTPPGGRQARSPSSQAGRGGR